MREKISAKTAHRKMVISAANRQKAIRQPASAAGSRQTIDIEEVNRSIQARKESAQAVSPRQTAREIKELEIQKAIKKAGATQTKQKKNNNTKFGFKRLFLAFVCSAIAVFAIVYYVNLNTPDINLKVAAMQTGIDAKYPGYVPRDFSLSNITSEDGKITLNFKNQSTGDSFTLIEEKSSWDSNALYANYVTKEYGEDYTLIREQGLTIYVGTKGAAWMNGGIFYLINFNSGMLTKKQIKTIAVSL